MSKIVAIDYGTKRSGIAITDDLQMMAFGLTAVPTTDLLSTIIKVCNEDVIDVLLIGLPLNLQGKLNELEHEIQKFILKIQNNLPNLPIERIDERFTSKMAEMSILYSGKKKKDRQNKFLVDEVSATILLQDYLENQKRKK